MVTKEIRSIRCDDALEILTVSGEAVFFTLTTPDEVSFHEIRERWRTFRHDFFRLLRKSHHRKPQYVMNYELHPGYLIKVVTDRLTTERVLHGDGHSHGWHIHGVVDSFLPSRVLLDYARRAGFGRVDFRRVTSKGVSDYLTKHALKAYKGLTKRERERYAGMRLRLVNTSRGLPPLNSYAYESAEIEGEARIKDRIINECWRGVDRADIDFRKVARHASVMRLMGFRQDWQLLKWLEGLQLMRKLEIANEKKVKKNSFP